MSNDGRKIALVTGSTDGVGRFVAVRLAAAGMLVLVHGRDAARGQQVLSDIRTAGGAGVFYLADLSSLAAVRRLGESVLREHARLDLLISNAGIGGAPNSPRELSADGFELRFAVNYLAGNLLTRTLLPRLKQSQPSRIVHVSSLGQQAIEFDDVMLERGYSPMRAYCQSKLAQILFTIDLAAELKGTAVTANCLHPATYMNTTMVRQGGLTPLSSVDEGGEAILNLALSPTLQARTGVFFNGLHESRVNEQAYDVHARQQLRLLSDRLVERAGTAPP